MSVWTKCRWRTLFNRQVLLKSPRRSFFEHRSHFFPAEQQGDEPDIHWKKTFDPTILIQQSKLFIKEQKEELYTKKAWSMNPSHDEVMIQWKFDKPETYEQFVVTADSESKQGFSQCELLMSKQKTAIFRGNIINKSPKDGKTTYAGFAAMKSKRFYKAFFREAVYENWAEFTHLLMKVRGDGRKYAIILNTPGHYDISFHDYYTYPLYTHGGPYWQFVTIPFSKFYKEVHTVQQDRQLPVMTPLRQFVQRYTNISSIAISLFDRTDGPFQLEIDFIGVYHDETHFEDFAYENYLMPFAFV